MADRVDDNLDLAPNEFQSRASKVGAAFEILAEQALSGAGFEILDKHYYIAQLGVQVDFRARNKKGVVFMVECKGSMHGNRPGLERTDTTKKALCNGFLLKKAGLGPFLLLASHLPVPGSDSHRMLAAAGRETVLDVIAIMDKSLMKRLQYFVNADSEAISKYVKNHPTLFEGQEEPPRYKQLRLPIVVQPPKPKKRRTRQAMQAETPEERLVPLALLFRFPNPDGGDAIESAEHHLRNGDTLVN